MMRSKRGAVFVALGAVVSVAAAACSSGSGSGSSSNGAGATTAAAKGGTLTVLTLGPQESWDPQRVYIGADIEYAARMAIRSLVTYTRDGQAGAGAGPRDGHRQGGRRRQDLEVHAEGRREVAGRQADHL